DIYGPAPPVLVNHYEVMVDTEAREPRAHLGKRDLTKGFRDGGGDEPKSALEMANERCESHAKVLSDDEDALGRRRGDGPSSASECGFDRDLRHQQCGRETMRDKFVRTPRFHGLVGELVE